MVCPCLSIPYMGIIAPVLNFMNKTQISFFLFNSLFKVSIWLLHHFWTTKWSPYNGLRQTFLSYCNKTKKNKANKENKEFITSNLKSAATSSSNNSANLIWFLMYLCRFWRPYSLNTIHSFSDLQFDIWLDSKIRIIYVIRLSLLFLFFWMGIFNLTLEINDVS